MVTTIQQRVLSSEDLVALCRGSEADGGAAYFDEIETAIKLDDFETLIRWHRIAHDATLNKPDIKKLAGKLVKMLIDFACTRGEAQLAADRFTQTGSTEGFSELQEKARNLFTKSGTTGEPGELLLYMLAERVLGLPQILCKFPHKTNPNVHAHGADGVHASADKRSGHLKLHWGEAKFVANVKQAIDQCFESLAELILEPEEGKKTKERDITLIRDFIDLNNKELEDAICSYLDPDQPLSNKIRFCGIGIVGFDLKSYEDFGEALKKKEKDKITSYIKNWAEIVKSSAKKHKLDTVEIDLFCIPCLSVDDFRKAFLVRLGVSNAN